MDFEKHDRGPDREFDGGSDRGLDGGFDRRLDRLGDRSPLRGIARPEGFEQKFLRIRRELRFWTRNTKVILIGVIVLCLGGVVFGEYGLLRIIEVKRDRGRLEAEITMWKMKQRLLEDEKEKLTGDPFTIEKMARERCGLYKPGELIFVFPDDSTSFTSLDKSALTR
jgi:cell division protein FtsB